MRADDLRHPLVPLKTSLDQPQLFPLTKNVDLLRSFPLSLVQFHPHPSVPPSARHNRPPCPGTTGQPEELSPGEGWHPRYQRRHSRRRCGSVGVDSKSCDDIGEFNSIHGHELMISETFVPKVVVTSSAEPECLTSICCKSRRSRGRLARRFSLRQWLFLMAVG